MYVDRNEWLTIEESAKYLKLSSYIIRISIKSGKLPAYHNGKGFKIKRTDLDAFLKKSQVGRSNYSIKNNEGE